MTQCKCDCHSFHSYPCYQCACRMIPGYEKKSTLRYLEECNDNIKRCFERLEQLEKILELKS